MIRIILIITVILASFILRSQSFTPITQSISNTFEYVEISEINNVAIAGGALATKSLDAGFTWTEMDLGAEGMPFTTYNFYDAVIISSNTYCLMGKDNINSRSKIIRTTDGGLTWSNVLETFVGSSVYFTHIVYNGTAVIVATNNGIYRSLDQGITWSFVSVTSGYMDLLQFNTTTGNIIATYSSSGSIRESTDNGATWSVNTWPSLSGVYKDVTNQNGNYLLLQNMNSTKYWFEIDNTNTPIDTIMVSSSLFQSTSGRRSLFLPNNKIILAIDNSSYLFNIDPLNGNVYLYSYNLQEQGGLDAEVRDMEIDLTYGLLVGEMGAITRISPSSNAELTLPPDYVLDGYLCPGDTLSGQASYTYADSVKWYYDGTLISTDTAFSYVTPTSFGTHNLVFYNWVGNIASTDTTIINFTPLSPTPNYTFSTYDSTPCYNSGVSMLLSYQSGQVAGSFYEIWQDSTLLFGPTSCTTSGFAQWSSAISTQDTFYTILSYPQTCGTYFDTLSFIAYPGQDLSVNYILLEPDTMLCVGDTVEFALVNTSSNCTYDFNVTNSISGSSGNLPSYQGVTGDTVWITGGTSIYNTYDQYLTYYQINISDNNGCSQGYFPLDTFQFIRPDAIFYTHSQNFYRTDTVELSNAFIRNNRFWEADPGGLYVLNVNDTIPVIYSDTVGFYNITLTNTPGPQCVDSIFQHIQYCDTLPSESDPLCWLSNGGQYRDFFITESDTEGNIYELGAIDGFPSGTPAPKFKLVKRDPSGNILWQKIPGVTFNMYTGGVMIEGIDFDENGDIYCALWIHSNWSLTYELINFSPLGSNNKTRCYIVKLDKNTGNMIWASDISSINSGLTSPTTTTRWRVSDIIVDDQKIYIAAGNSGIFAIVAADMQGNIIVHEEAGAYYPNTFHMPSGSNGNIHESFEYAKLDKLSTGEILCAVYYSGNPMINYISQPQYSPLLAASQSHRSLMLMKYTINDGFYKAEKVVQALDFYKPNMYPLLVVDDNDNINIAVSFGNEFGSDLPANEKDTLWIRDSLILTLGTSVVCQLDTAYNINWLSRGSFARITDLDLARLTGDLIISGKTTKNIGFTSEGESKMMGYYGTYGPEYGTDPLSWELSKYYASVIELKDMFTYRFSNLGEILSGRFYEVDTTLNFWYNNLYIKSSVTPCGDITSFINYFPNGLSGSVYFKEGNTTYQLDSMLILKYAGNCGLDSCFYLGNIQDTAIACLGSSNVEITFTQSYNIDSVSYYLLDNGSVIDTNSVAISGNSFNAIIPITSSNYSIALFEPIIDTIIINQVTPIVPIYSYEDTVCEGTLITITPSPSNIYYEWPNSTTTLGGSYSINAYTSGQFIFNINSIDTAGCAIDTVLTVEAIAPIDPGFSNNYDLFCNDTLVVLFNQSIYTTNNWFVNSNSCSNFFTPSLLIPGNNSVEVNLVDTNSCSQTASFNISYIDFINPGFLNSYFINCNDELTLTLPTNTYLSDVWTLNGNSSTNTFNSGNLNVGVNTLEVDLVDTNNCSQTIEVELIYCSGVGYELLEISEQSILIYPNPTNGYITFKASKFLDDNALVEIKSVDGRIIDVLEFNGSELLEYELNEDKGTYLITLTTDLGKHTYKIIKI